MNGWKWKFLSACLLVAAAMQPASALACAACYGASDSPLAKGMNWGILSLLVVVVFVLGSIASFFVFLAKKSAAVAAADSAESKDQPTQQS